MLIQFIVKNYACFKEEVKLSMVASNYDQTRREDNVIEVPKFNLNLLRSAVIYGANASGKSKLLQAMHFMYYFVQTSFEEKRPQEGIAVIPYKLSTTTDNQPSLFEITFIYKDEIYRYGFEATEVKVVSEWLYLRKTTRETEIFYRNYQDFEIHSSFKSGKFLIDNDMVRETTLFLSTMARFKNKITDSVLSWLNEKFRVFYGHQDDNYIDWSMDILNNEATRNSLMTFIKGADLNILDLKTVTLDMKDLPKDMPEELKEVFSKRIRGKNGILTDIHVSHKKYDENNNFVGIQDFSLDIEESLGTRKYFAFSAPLVSALKIGATVSIDELDAKLHSKLVAKIVDLFNSKETNSNNAQLIFNTHDTNLLSSGLFRRDQIWFTEKDRYGAATLYSLNDFKKENGEKARKEEDYEANYIEGRYGAVPYLGSFDKLFKSQNTPAYETEK